MGLIFQGGHFILIFFFFFYDKSNKFKNVTNPHADSQNTPNLYNHVQHTQDSFFLPGFSYFSNNSPATVREISTQ